jgi:3-oxoacyl-[acyl-carrier-protein] synthase II
MDEYSKVGLTAIAFALKDAGLEERSQRCPVGVIASTLHGCLKTDLDYFDTVAPQGGVLASPHLFAYTLPNSFLGEAAIVFGLTGTSYVIIAALRLALLSIAGQEHEMMLAGVCDTGGRPPFTTEEACLPGAVFLLLEHVARSGATPYGSVVLDEEGTVFFNGAEKVNVIELVQGCLEGHENQADLSQLA